MSTEVLRPQLPPAPRNCRRNFPPNRNRRRVRRKLNHNGGHDSRQSSSTGLVMGKVRLLRRGEPLSSVASSVSSEDHPSSQVHDPIDESTGSGSGTESTCYADVIYAGTAFSVAPSPMSLPLPTFSRRKDLEFEDGAAMNLKRLLRLD